MSEKKEKRDSRIAVQGIKTLGDLSETAITQAASVVKELYKASKANPLMGIAAFLFTMDFFEKLGIIYPSTAMSGREACFAAIGLQFNAQQAANFKAWETAIPVIGYFMPSSNISVETILKTSLTVDATGGESIIREAVKGASESAGDVEAQVTKALAKLLPAAAAAE